MSGSSFAVPDVTLHLDTSGVIREASLGNAVAGEAVGNWLGRPWVETVDDGFGSSVLKLLDGARANGVSDFRHVSQRFPSGRTLSVEYNAVRLGRAAGLIAVGRSLAGVTELEARLRAAQQAREQDHWKRREIETRYRLLFESSSEPVLLLGADALAVLEANPAAGGAWGIGTGCDFAALVSAADRPALRAMVTRVRERGSAPGIIVHLGAERVPWFARASLGAQEPASVFLLQFSRVGTAARAAVRPLAASDRILDGLPDGFALVDERGAVCRVNAAFLDLVQAVVPAAVIGAPLGRWLSHAGADASVLMANVLARGAVRNFPTLLQGDLGTEASVEISAFADREGAAVHVGLLLRDVSRRLPGERPSDATVGALDGLSGQIGKVPLLRLVKDAATSIERRCIEGALQQAGGNRTAAAELLGLSRQSLYAKLSRYNLDPDGDHAALTD